VLKEYHTGYDEAQAAAIFDELVDRIEALEA